jgi:hypothetical protein
MTTTLSPARLTAGPSRALGAGSHRRAPSRCRNAPSPRPGGRSTAVGEFIIIIMIMTIMIMIIMIMIIIHHHHPGPPSSSSAPPHHEIIIIITLSRLSSYNTITMKKRPVASS